MSETTTDSVPAIHCEAAMRAAIDEAGYEVAA